MEKFPNFLSFSSIPVIRMEPNGSEAMMEFSAAMQFIYIINHEKDLLRAVVALLMNWLRNSYKKKRSIFETDLR